MKPWLNFKDIFSFKPPALNPSPAPLTEIYKEFMSEGPSSAVRAELENIRFDNSMRIVISVVALIGALVLRWGHVITNISPVLYLFAGYVALQIGCAAMLARVRKFREINFALCTVDILALSSGVYWTGGAASPLYFVYFMPLIIQAFHRDWALLTYYGIMGIVSYSVVVMASAPAWTSQSLVGLMTRIFFMSLTVGIALLAVNLLRKKEGDEKKKMSRLKCLVYLSQRLNGIHLMKDLAPVVEQFVKVLNLELFESVGAWTRIFLVQSSNPFMAVIQDSSQQKNDLKQSISSHACPAVQGNRLFQIKNADTETGCPVEQFSAFKSHLCTPISGEMNEGFGVIFAGSERVDAFQPDDIQFLNFIGKSIGLTVQRLKRMEELNLVVELDSCALATFMGSTRTLDDTYSAIVDGVRTILNADRVVLFIWNPQVSRLEATWVGGLYKNESLHLSYPMGEGIPGRVLESEKPYWTYNLDTNPLYDEKLPFKGMLCVPIMSLKGEPLGVVMGSLMDPQRTFSIEEIDLVATFCTRAVVALENVDLHLKERGEQEEVKNKAA